MSDTLRRALIDSLTKNVDNVAVKSRGGEISYAELNNISDEYASFISKKFGSDEKVVPIFLNNSIEVIYIIFGILKTGRGFMPIDLRYPVSRVLNVCKNLGTNKIVTDYDFESKNDLIAVQFNSLDRDKNYDIVDNNIMYIMHTSGTTGVPKGVCIEKDSFMSFYHGITNAVSLNGYHSFLSSTAISFDISLFEIIVPILLHKTVVVANKIIKENTHLFKAYIQEMNVDVLQTTPSTMNMLIADGDIKFLKNLRLILIGGEKFSHNLLKILKNNSRANIFNMYGPTEATIWCMVSDLTTSDFVNIGKPFGKNKIKLVVNEVGSSELYIGGPQLAVGYLNATDETRKNFLMDNERYYKSGDIVSFVDDDFVFVGRYDRQIKLRGHRIELDEIESVMQKIIPITDLCVVCVGDESSRVLIGCYASQHTLNHRNLLKKTGDILPDYMVPSKLVRFDRFPKTSAGKIDYSEIKKILVDGTFTNEVTSNSKDNIKDISTSILSLISKHTAFSSAIIPSMSFKEAGVNSITLVSIIVMVEEQYQLVIDDNVIFNENFKKIEDLIDYVVGKVR